MQLTLVGHVYMYVGSGRGVMVRIYDLHSASRGFESQKSQWWWQEGHLTLIRS